MAAVGVSPGKRASLSTLFSVQGPVLNKYVCIGMRELYSACDCDYDKVSSVKVCWRFTTAVAAITDIVTKLSYYTCRVTTFNQVQQYASTLKQIDWLASWPFTVYHRWYLTVRVDSNKATAKLITSHDINEVCIIL
eukprot:7728-Heterococcus_DN1.PRE.3